MNIIASNQPQPQPPCPDWCVVHSPSDGELVHYSEIAEVVPTAGGPAERRPFEVSVEQLRTPTVLLSGSGNPMTPVEAIRLAGLLQWAGFTALGMNGDGDWPATKRWAEQLVADPTTDPHVRGIVANLLGQVDQ